MPQPSELVAAGSEGPAPSRSKYGASCGPLTSAVVSSSNSEGRLTNSDLEMAAVLLQFNVLETCVPTLQHVKTVIHSDYSPSVAWATTMATKTEEMEAAHWLLHGLAMCQRSLEAGPLMVVHIAGKLNTLADTASRPHLRVPKPSQLFDMKNKTSLI